MAASSPVSAVGTQLHGFNVRENLIQQEFDLSGFSLWQTTDIFNGLMDDGMRTIFTMGTILTILEEVSILSKKMRLAKVFGPFWNYFDAAGYYAAMIVKLHQRNYWGAFCDFFMGTMLAALTAVCFAKFGGFAFAACMWDSFFRSLPDLVTSLSNASDDYALMCGVTTKSEKAYLKIKSIDEKLAGSDDLSAGDVDNLKAQRKTFAADYKRYATQARALHDTLKCEHRDNERTDEQNELLEEVDQYLNSSQSYLIHDIPISPQDAGVIT